MNPFKRFYNTDAAVVSYKIDDYSGEKTTITLGTLKADIQSYSGGKAYEEYGVEIECQKCMFCDPDPNISLNNHVKINGEVYEIVYIAEWETGLEVMLKRVRLE